MPVSGLAPALYGYFSKADPYSVAFTAPTGSTVSLKAGTRIALPSGIVIAFLAATAVQMPALTAGTDYAIYLCSDGTLRASANFLAPAGFDATTSRQIGGFHYAPGGNAAAQLGGNTTPAINPYSFWDLKWRPACTDPRGMALVANNFWCDIYLLGVDWLANGTSRNNVTIADGSSPPKIPTLFGGDGSAAYADFNWWEAAEVMAAAGKRLLDYDQFAAAAYGVTEEQSRGNDAVTTGLGTTNAGSTNTDEEQTSKWGIIQAAGVMWIWGNQFGGGYGDTDVARGYQYSQPHAALFAGAWGNGASSGSRASSWDNAPTYSGNGTGARGRCDHLVHV